MYCPKCGKELENGIAFCPDCGAKIEAQPSDPITDSAPSTAQTDVYYTPSQPAEPENLD